MESILYQMFSGDYDLTPELDKTQQEIRNQIFAELDQVEAVFGSDFLEHLFELDYDFNDWKNFQSYRSGFRLGVQLMLEALKPG